MIASFEGEYFAPGSAVCTTVLVAVHAGGDACILSDGVELRRFRWQDAAISDPIGDLPRRITLGDGAAIVTRDNGAVDRIEAAIARSRAGRWIEWLERRKAAVLAAVAIAFLAAWAFVSHGIPAASRALAATIPPGLLSHASAETLAMLDRRLLTDTELSTAEQEKVAEIFARVRRAAGADGICCRLLFRKGQKIGANALALPDGTVIVTDQLISRASPGGLTGVLAHEIAHVEKRHTLRGLIEASLLSVVVMTALGDLSEMAEILVSYPILLMRLGYSRDFEREADDFALEIMARMGVSPDELASLLENITGKCGDDCPPSWLSTHPAPAERIARLRASGSP